MKTGAPARVNLIGDHTDYQDGLCLPMAIDRDVRIEWTRRDDERITLDSDSMAGRVEIALGSDAGTEGPAWGSAVAATVAALRERGHRVGAIDGNVRSTVPVGSGLSSSAAFGVALALALTNAAGAPISGTELALTAQRAEHIVGVPCGVMDQMASVYGQRGHALLLDCRSLAIEPIPLPAELAVVVVHSGLPRRLADSAYALRRAAVAEAAARIGVPTLRDAHLVQVLEDPFARHVVTENERVVEFARALRGDDRTELGALMNASHTSLRDDFAVSTKELDALVDALLEAGALGARLTGAGFGGSVVALAPTGRAATIATNAAQRYRAATGLTPTPFVAAAVDGASTEG
jgi:galactokinase